MRTQAKFLRCLALTATSVTALAVTGGASAQDDAVSEPWQICNETSYILRAAVGTGDEGQMSARGWERLRPGACISVDAVSSQRYVYAESSPAYQGGIREWAGRTPFCVAEQNFEISNKDVCKTAGHSSRNYLAVKTDEKITRFVEPNNFSRRAETAGVQRLLRENGYRVSRIDGVAGRRTARTLSTFVKDKKLAANLTTIQQIDALEKAAAERMATLGVTFCNKSTNRIWTAVGHRLKDDWESRGWWSVNAGECIQPITTALIGSSTYIYARQEQPANENGGAAPDKYLRSETADPSQFCVSGARFTARGREACRANGYEAASFRPLAADKDGVTINLTDADFAAPSGVGLRR